MNNFLWDIEQYFRVMGIIEDGAKVNTASLYLIDATLLWWHRRLTDVRHGGSKIGT